MNIAPFLVRAEVRRAMEYQRLYSTPKVGQFQSIESIGRVYSWMGTELSWLMYFFPVDDILHFLKYQTRFSS